MSAQKRIFLNGLANALQKVVLAGQHLLLVPLFLRAWGPTYYGEWLTLTAVPTALSLSDIGLGTAVANSFVLSYAAGDQQRAANIMKTGGVLITAVCGSVAAVGAVAIHFLANMEWVERLEISRQVAIPAIAFLGLSRLLSFFVNLGEAYFRAAKQTYAFIHFITALAVGRIGVGAGVLIAGGNAMHFALSDLALSVITVVATFFIGRSLIAGLPAGRFTYARQELGGLFAKSVAYMLNPVWHAVSIQGTTLVVRTTLGAEAVAVFATMRTLCNSVHQVLSTVNTSVFPELQLALATKQMDSARKLYLGGIACAVSLSAIAIVALAIYGPWVYIAWTRGRLTPTPSLWGLFLATLLLRSIWSTAATAFRAVNRPEGITIASLLSACTGVAASWALSRTWGTTGAACGMLLMEAFMIFYTMPASCRLVGQPLASLPSALISCHIATIQEAKERTLRGACNILTASQKDQ